MAIIGDNGIHSFNVGFYGGSGNGKVAIKINLPTDGYVTLLSQRVSQSGGNRLAKGFIYSVSGGEPDVLLATSSEQTVSNTGESAFKNFYFSPGVFLTAGDYYFGVITDSVSGGVQVFNGTKTEACSVRYNNETYTDGASSPFGSATSADTSKLLLYVEYTPVFPTAWLKA